MLVLDNFYPKTLIDTVILEANVQKWEFARIDSNEDLYWTNVIFGSNYSQILEQKNFLSEFTSENVKKCWEFFKLKADCNLEDSNLSSVYFNGLTYGIEAHAHVDAMQKDVVTVITYVCEDWNSHWSGETVFFSGEFSHNPADVTYYQHEITQAVLPRYNRIVVFSADVVHAVRPLSRSFRGLRKTLMFKIKGKRVEDFKKLCS
jgi:Rps23 Pro-64 3,4-dihydroxylase Tpa1-like proline 4-hydroxylase